MNQDLEWERRYQEKDTPWNKGTAAPALLSYLREKEITGRVLVPGCGPGHEVRALGRQAETTVIGLDISPTAVAQAKTLGTGEEPGSEICFVEGDFFNLPKNLKGSFDWVVEHTCFCAIEPHQREQYALSASQCLKPGGRIFGIFYINPDKDSAPPFRVSKEELNKLFDPYFDLVEEWVPQEYFPGRENRELVRILQKR